MNAPKIATLRAKCLKSGIERSIASSRIRIESSSNAALTLADARVKLYIEGRSGACRRIMMSISKGRRENAVHIPPAFTYVVFRKEESMEMCESPSVTVYIRIISHCGLVGRLS